jgi:hypothetical protein
VGRTKANIVKDDPRDNELWLQQPDGSFVDQGTAWGSATRMGEVAPPSSSTPTVTAIPTCSSATSCLAAPTRTTVPTARTAVHQPVGQWFVAAPGYGLHQFVGAFCAHPIDYNRDGWQDLFLCGSQRSVLYRNDAGQGFTEVTAGSGIIAAKRKDADFGDLDGDGDLDAVSVGPTNVKYQLFPTGSSAPAEPSGLSAPGVQRRWVTQTGTATSTSTSSRRTTAPGTCQISCC